MSKVRKCDECGATTSSTLAGQWIGVTLGPFAQPGDRGGQRLLDSERTRDFCSYCCLAVWATERETRGVVA